MTCPFCQNRFTPPTTPARCPECGCEVMRLTSGLVKTSAVLIASDDKRAVYRSVQDVPEPLRRRLVESTQGINSATIVIADHGGREHMEKHMERPAEASAAMPGEPAPIFETSVEAASEAPGGAPGETVARSAPRSHGRLLGIGLAAAALAGVAAWVLHGLQW